MALLFGNLTQAFVDFGVKQVASNAPNATEADRQAFIQARDHFASVSAQDASYLVYIGTS